MERELDKGGGVNGWRRESQMTNFEYERLHHNLKLLKLRTFESVLDIYLEIAAKEKKSTLK
jgi:hypothetical protein